MTDRTPLPPTAAIFFAIVLIASLVAGDFATFDLRLWTLGLSLSMLPLAALAIYGSTYLRRTAMLALLSMVAAHAAITAADLRHPDDHPLLTWLDDQRQDAQLDMIVTDGPIFHERGISFDARLIDIDTDETGHLTDPAPRIRVFYPTPDLPACSPLPLPGDQVRSWARIQPFAPADVSWRLSQRRLMMGRGYVARATVREPLQFLDSSPPSFALRTQRLLTRHRLSLERRLATYLDGHAEAVATAMLTGSRGQITPEFREPFDITSTGHILAISGLHFAVIAALIALLIRLVTDRFPGLYRRWPRRVIIGVITVVLLLIYTLAIGAPVSAQRAFGMTALAIGFLCFSPWRLSPLSALALTAALLLLYRPGLVTEIGYQLSVCATAGILCFIRFRPASLRPPKLPGPNEESRYQRWRRRILIFIGLSISATIATWPVLVRMTGELPLGGLWANIVVVPLVSSILFPLLVMGALLSGIWPTAAQLLLSTATDGLLLIHTALDIAAYHPGATIRWGTPTALESMGFFMGSAIAIVGGLRLRSCLVASCAAAIFLMPGFVGDALETRATTIHFIYVGQGDATLVEFDDGTTVLIDAGGRPVGSDPGLQQVVPYLRHRGIRRLDAVVLTHGDYDHYGGLSAVIRPFRPRHFYLGAEQTHPNLDALRHQMKRAGTTVHPVERRAVIAGDDLHLNILRPLVDGPDPNDQSLVIHFSYAGAGVLLTGDIEAAGEQWLTTHMAGPFALMKVPHHGSNTSSTPDFLDHFRPALAVASCGRHNRFHHPHPDVITRYRQRDIDLWRTDRRGAIIARLDDRGVLSVRSTRLPQ